MKAVEEQANFFEVIKQIKSNDKNEILMKSVHKSIAEYYLQELSSRIKEEMATRKEELKKIRNEKESKYFSQELSPRIKEEIERKKVESEKEKITNEG